MAFKFGDINAIRLENEKISLLILPGHGCDIAEIIYKPHDLSFLWRTERGLNCLDQSSLAISDPFNQTYHGGWFEAFPNVGLDCKYNGVDFQPYDEVKYLKWNYTILVDEPEKIVIQFSTHTLKAPFIIEKTITIVSGETGFIMKETIKNTGAYKHPYQWGHHPLLGAPFLSEKCQIDFDGADIDTPFEFDNARVKQNTKGKWPTIEGKNGMVDIRNFPPPGSDINDLYWLSKLSSARVAVRNMELNIGIEFTWDKTMFNHCLFWINANGDKGYPHFGKAYTLCVMPSTSEVHTLDGEDKAGVARNLNPGESISSWIRTTIIHED